MARKLLHCVALFWVAACGTEGRLVEYDELCLGYGEAAPLSVVEREDGHFSVSVPNGFAQVASMDDWEVMELRVGTGIWPDDEYVRWAWPGPELGDFVTTDFPGELLPNSAQFFPERLPDGRRFKMDVMAQWYSGAGQSGRKASCVLATGEVDRL
jgi:hypothetical protein